MQILVCHIIGVCPCVYHWVLWTLGFCMCTSLGWACVNVVYINLQLLSQLWSLPQACSSRVMLLSIACQPKPHHYIHNWSVSCVTWTRGVITLVISIEYLGLYLMMSWLCNTSLPVLNLTCDLMFLSLINQIKMCVRGLEMVQITFVISSKQDSVIFAFTTQDMAMRWVICEAEACEPVTNDLYKDQCV